jgi:hypothetical protein
MKNRNYSSKNEVLMKKKYITTLFLVFMLATPSFAAPGFVQGGKKVGQGFKEIVLATGRTFKESGKAIGRGFKKAGTETGKAFKTMGKEIGRAFSSD